MGLPENVVIWEDKDVGKTAEVAEDAPPGECGDLGGQRCEEDTRGGRGCNFEECLDVLVDRFSCDDDIEVCDGIG